MSAELPSVTEFDAAAAAVQAALDAGARYADARVMHRRYEAMSARNGSVEDVAQFEDSGLGVRALVGSGWGFFAVPDLADIVGAGGRRAGRREIAAASAAVARGSLELLPASPVTGSWASECVIDPLGVALSDKGDLLVAGDDDDARARRRHRRGPVPGVGHRQVVRVERGPPHRPADPRVRRRDHGHGDRRRRDPTPLLPGGTWPVRHPWLGARRRDRPAAPTPPAWPTRRGRCCRRRRARAARPR